MPRDSNVYCEDIRAAVAKIRRYISGSTREAFVADEKTVDAVVRNLEIIGEAVKNLPPEFREARPSIDWRKISGLRDILAHEYFGLDLDLIWDVVRNKLDDLVASLDAPS